MSLLLTKKVLVFCEVDTLLPRAETFAQKIGGQLIQNYLPTQEPQNYLVVNFSKEGVNLQEIGGNIGGAVTVDFVGGKLGYRRKHQEAKPLIAKAVGVQPKIKPTVWDMTAGLGQDAYVLAQLGCEVLMFERHPIVYELLRSGLDGARREGEHDEDLKFIVDRLSLSETDSFAALENIVEESIVEQGRPDVIYLDPMFPERTKSAKVKKGMQMFHQLVGADEDSTGLLPLALNAAKYRVVVKRSKTAPSLDGKAVPLQFHGKAMRFDVYPLKKMLSS